MVFVSHNIARLASCDYYNVTVVTLLCIVLTNNDFSLLMCIISPPFRRQFISTIKNVECVYHGIYDGVKTVLNSNHYFSIVMILELLVVLTIFSGVFLNDAGVFLTVRVTLFLNIYT